MTTMNISLPEDLRAFVESHVVAEGYGSSSEYMRELIRKDRQRAHLRSLIMAGIEDPVTHVADHAFWAERGARLDHLR